MKACCFTGHRKIEQRHLGKIDDLVSRAVAFAYEAGCRRFFVGGAIGFDTVAAKQVILFRIMHPDAELHVIAPCRNQSDAWSSADVSRYEYILSNANTVEYVSDVYTDGCMKERNKRMVELSDIVFAYVSRNYSGSAQTVRLAQKAGKTVYNLYPALDS